MLKLPLLGEFIYFIGRKPVNVHLRHDYDERI
jgi:hypothetical protein